MELFRHTIKWCKGEIFVGKMSLFFGLVILAINLLSWTLSATYAIKEMFTPLLAVASIAIGTGFYMMKENNTRLLEYSAEFKRDKIIFLKKEKERSQGLIKWYPYTRIILGAVMVSSIFCVIIPHKPIVRAIGIALMVLVTYVFILDYFTERSVKNYYLKIVESLS
jgi:hypothetical protein